MVKSLIFSTFIVLDAIKHMVKSSILNQYMNICKDVLSEVKTKLNKSFKDFIVETLLLYMVIPQRIN
jgi:hypothetical protein